MWTFTLFPSVPLRVLPKGSLLDRTGLRPDATRFTRVHYTQLSSVSSDLYFVPLNAALPIINQVRFWLAPRQGPVEDFSSREGYRRNQHIPETYNVTLCFPKTSSWYSDLRQFMP